MTEFHNNGAKLYRVAGSPDAGTRPAVIRPRRLRGGALTRSTAMDRAVEAGQVRRTSIAWMIRVAAWTSVAIVPLALLALSDTQLLSGGGTAIEPLWLCAGFTGLVAIGVMTGVVAGIREEVALSRLRQAAQRLTASEASRLAARLRDLPGDEHREAISVLREVLEREPGEVVPASAPAGTQAEVSPCPDSSV